ELAGPALAAVVTNRREGAGREHQQQDREGREGDDETGATHRRKSYLIAGWIAVDHDLTAARVGATAATASSSAGLYSCGRLVSCRWSSATSNTVAPIAAASSRCLTGETALSRAVRTIDDGTLIDDNHGRESNRPSSRP